ncbi:hypothetical protein [Flavobacterium sp.]|uniref:hypothetical protein n=1 Tax=Flavobacterium sp. TaxID=239 RepID=UPI0026209CDF|nr:hypothetical protein [Flavobacterium sp.]MDG2431126.1 hypothetical protein [Flavobacterium sp.]
MKNNHLIWMIIGCGLPLLLIFLAPAFGIRSSSSLFIFILLMFAIHLFIPHGSHNHGGGNHSQHEQKQQELNKEIPSVESKDHKHH